MGEWLFHHLLEAEEEPEKETELGKSRVTNKTKLLRKKKGWNLSNLWRLYGKNKITEHWIQQPEGQWGDRKRLQSSGHWSPAGMTWGKNGEQESADGGHTELIWITCFEAQ